jgi:hypothetical protein
MLLARYSMEDLVSAIQALFISAQNMQRSVQTVLNDPNNVFDDDDMLCRVVPPLLDACIEELGDMLEGCKAMEQNFKKFLAWVHPESVKAVKTQDVLLWFETLIKNIRECNDKNEALWVDDEASVGSSSSAATIISTQKRGTITNASEQVNDDSLEEFLAQSAKRIGINI